MSLKRTGIINKLDKIKMASGLLNFLLSLSSHSGFYPESEVLSLRNAQRKILRRVDQS